MEEFDPLISKFSAYNCIFERFKKFNLFNVKKEDNNILNH